MSRVANGVRKRAGKNRVSVRGARNDLGGPLQSVVEVLLRPSSFRSVRHAIVSLSDETIVGWEFLSRGPAGSFEMPSDFFRLALERNPDAGRSPVPAHVHCGHAQATGGDALPCQPAPVDAA